MRGKGVEIGSTRVNKNGYTYIKQMIDGKEKWVAAHYVVAEQKLGRPLHDNERVAFLGSRSNLDPSNIVVKIKDGSPLERQIRKIDDQIAELIYKKEHLTEQLKQKKPDAK